MIILKEIRKNSNEFLLLEIFIFILTLITGIYACKVKILSNIDFFLNLIFLIAFLIMGFRLPQNKYHKIGYNTAQSFIIFILPIIFSDHILFVPDLGVLAFFRNYQMFGIRKSIYYLVFLVIFSIATYEYINSPYKIVQKSNYTMINSIYFILASAIALCFVIIAKESQKKLAIALKQVQEYSIKIEEQAIQIERNRIKRDMHDSLGYNLTAINFQLENGLNLIEKSQYEQANETFIASQELVQECLDNMRSIISDFSNKSLVESSFEKEIIKLIKDFKKTTTIHMQFSISIKNHLSPEIINTIYRITQECLTNILRHSGATKVGIVIFARDNVLNFIVKDDGRGFESNNPIIGFGLVGIKERVHNLNGKCEIITKPEDGCQISIEIPLQQNP